MTDICRARRQEVAGLCRFLDSRFFLPPPSQVFAALEACPPEKVRVLILGQDPYPTPGDAHGLAFSCDRDDRPPASLRNIFRELERDTGLRRTRPRLDDWARQGVLLLNRVLTVDPGAPGSHRKQGWEAITAGLIEAVARQQPELIICAWGADAQAAVAALSLPRGTTVLQAGHPSPLAYHRDGGFKGCGHFARINSLLGDAAPRWA